MKKLFVLFLFVTLFSSSVFAIDKIDKLKVAVIDMNQILQKSPLMISMNENLAKKFSPRQQELFDAKKQLQEETDQLSLKAETMSEDDRTRLQNRIIEDKTNVAILAATLEKDLAIAKNSDLEAFRGRFNTIINKIAQDENYDLIQERTTIIYLNDKLDITQKVLQQMT